MFQSLSRDSGRLNPSGGTGARNSGSVSIPQSGFGAFEQRLRHPCGGGPEVSIPQSGFGAFEPPAPPRGVHPRTAVSIPQSGFGAFEPAFRFSAQGGRCPVSIPQSGFGAFELLGQPKSGAFLLLFQSLSRDSGRLNSGLPPGFAPGNPVSIPQSGFGAFEREMRRLATVGLGSFNPSVGIRGV